MNAESREEVFAELRKQGIKAIKVVAADGSKANGEIRGIRKRVLAASVILTAVLAGSVMFFLLGDSQLDLPKKEARPLDRQEIAGDRLRIAEAADTIFTSKAESYLARFAEPGAALPSSNIAPPSSDEVVACLNQPILYSDGEFTEHIDLKRIVAGMKQEIRLYLKGGGQPAVYLQELIKRQEMEIERKDKAHKHLQELLKNTDVQSLKKAYDYYLKANAQLHSMGIAPLKMPYELLNYQASLDLSE